MQINVLETKNLVSLKVAQELSEHILAKPNLTIGLATGNTMVSVYECFKVIVNEKSIDLSKVHFTMLDEYWDIPINHPASFKNYLLKALDGLGLRDDQFVFHRTDLGETESCHFYNKRIEELGGIDVQLLGIGLNGHIAFNEPGTPFDQLTHVIDLTESTIKANEKDFQGASPKKAITMGIKNILAANSLIMIALGESKAAIVEEAFFKNSSVDCPASSLQNHRNLKIFLDKNAAQKVNERSSL